MREVVVRIESDEAREGYRQLAELLRLGHEDGRVDARSFVRSAPLTLDLTTHKASASQSIESYTDEKVLVIDFQENMVIKN